jgi:hypothetical protein
MTTRSYPKLQLASTEKSWNELKALMAQHVEYVCGNGNTKTVHSLMFLIDVLTNDEFDADERSTAAEHAQNVAFTFSEQLPIARENYLNTINPARTQRRRRA